MLRLLTGVSLGTGARAVFIFTQWLQLAIVARATDPAVVGAYGLALAIAAPIFLFCNSGLRSEFVTAKRSSAPRFVIYFVLRSVTVAVAVLLVTATALLFYPAEALFVMVGVALVKAQESIGDILQAWLQRERRFGFMFVGLSFRGIAGALSFAAAFALGGSLTEALALQFVTGLLALAGLDLLFVLRTSRLPAQAWWSHFSPPPRRLRFGGSTPGWGGPLALAGTLHRRRHLLFHSSWLGAAGFGGSFIHNVPRYFVEARMGLEAVGYFTALHYVIHAGSMIVISASVMLLYPMSRMIAQNELRRLVMLITGSVLAILVGSIAVWVTFFFFGEPILGLLYGKDYATYLSVLLILLMGGCFRFVWLFLSYVLIAWRRFRLHFVLMSVCVAAATISCWLLIDGQSLMSAAFAVIATYLFTTALYLGTLLVQGLLFGRSSRARA